MREEETNMNEMNRQALLLGALGENLLLQQGPGRQ